MKLKPYCLWLFGMPNSGKSTLAYHLLQDKLRNVVVIDGDQYRQHLSPVGFSFKKKDIIKNNLSAAKLVEFLMGQGFNVIVAMITPYEEARKKIRDFLDGVIFVWLDADLRLRKARPNYRPSKIKFEKPSKGMRLSTHKTIEENMAKIYKVLEKR